MNWRPFDYRPATPEKRRDLESKKLLIVTDAAYLIVSFLAFDFVLDE